MSFTIARKPIIEHLPPDRHNWCLHVALTGGEWYTHGDKTNGFQSRHVPDIQIRWISNERTQMMLFSSADRRSRRRRRSHAADLGRYLQVWVIDDHITTHRFCKATPFMIESWKIQVEVVMQKIKHVEPR